MNEIEQLKLVKIFAIMLNNSHDFFPAQILISISKLCKSFRTHIPQLQVWIGRCKEEEKEKYRKMLKEGIVSHPVNKQVVWIFRNSILGSIVALHQNEKLFTPIFDSSVCAIELEVAHAIIHSVVRARFKD